jgi:hypothetical protein
MKTNTKICAASLIAVLVVAIGTASTGFAKDKDNNPPGPAGGPGTNWENPPGPAGGPGAGPDVRGPYHHHSQFCKKHPWHKKCHYNPPGPAGGPGAGPVPPPPPGKYRVDRDNNPPGPAGGRGTNWENPPGPVGGPGASPNRKPKPR